MILALAGGVGGAKLAHGLALRLPPERLQIVVNTGDDFVHLGLHISPDLDTVMYWLAGLNDSARGWGLADESWNFMAALEQRGGPDWFRLGDRDLATHVERTIGINAGQTLSHVTQSLCGRLGVRHRIAPMTDQKVRTVVHTDEGELEFQHYFVRRRCEPKILRLDYCGAGKASPSPAFETALSGPLEAIVVCPSNPMLSIEPILAIDGVRKRIEQHSAPVVAVSPIVAGRAVKGPAAKIFRELGQEPSALTVARRYAGLIDGLIIDRIDAALWPEIEKLGLAVAAADTIMRTKDDQARLADTVVTFATGLKKRRS